MAKQITQDRYGVRHERFFALRPRKTDTGWKWLCYVTRKTYPH